MIPEDCKLPDLSDLRTPLLPFLLAGLMTGHSDFDPPFGLHLRNFVRLVDKALREYSLARSAVLEQIDEGRRSSAEIMETGRILYIFDYVDHFETCLNAANRLIRQVDQIKKGPGSEHIDRLARKKMEAFCKEVKPIRDALEHIEERIQNGEIGMNQTVMISISDDGERAQVAGLEMTFGDFAITLRMLHEIALSIVDQERTVVAST